MHSNKYHVTEDSTKAYFFGLSYRPYYKAIVFCLTRKPYVIRKFTLMTVKRILSLLGGTSISLSLVEVFGEILATQKVGEGQSNFAGMAHSTECQFI